MKGPIKLASVRTHSDSWSRLSEHEAEIDYVSAYKVRAGCNNRGARARQRGCLNIPEYKRSEKQ